MLPHVLTRGEIAPEFAVGKVAGRVGSSTARKLAPPGRRRSRAAITKQKAQEGRPEQKRSFDPVRLAVAARNLGGLAEARRLLDIAIQVSDPNPLLYYLRGRVLLESGRRWRAAADFGRGLRWAPESTKLARYLREALGPRIPRNAAKAVYFEEQANVCYAKRDLVSTIDFYDRAIEVSAPNTSLFYSRGMLKKELGDVLGAAADFRAGLGLEPQNETLRFVLAHTVPTPDLIDLSQAARLQTEGEAATLREEHGTAHQCFGDAIAMSPPNTALYFLRGISALRIGDRKSAAADFEMGLRLDPFNEVLVLLFEDADLQLKDDPDRLKCFSARRPSTNTSIAVGFGANTAAPLLDGNPRSVMASAVPTRNNTETVPRRSPLSVAVTCVQRASLKRWALATLAMTDREIGSWKGQVSFAEP